MLIGNRNIQLRLFLKSGKVVSQFYCFGYQDWKTHTSLTWTCHGFVQRALVKPVTMRKKESTIDITLWHQSIGNWKSLSIGKRDRDRIIPRLVKTLKQKMK